MFYGRGESGPVRWAFTDRDGGTSGTPYASLNLGEEVSGDTGSSTMPGPDSDGDAFDDTLLKRCQIRDDGVKSLVPELGAEFLQIRLLDRADALEA